MLIDGDSDDRTPPAAGGEAMFRALKYRKVPVVMVRFPDESHELSRSGAPWRRIDRLRHILGWFDKWLKGENKPEYDVPVRSRTLRNPRIGASGSAMCYVPAAIGASSSSRILRSSAVGVNGFCRNATPGSSTPWRTIASSV